VDAVAALERVVAALPGGGEARPGQVEMTAAVERAVATGRHLVVQAGTGTGKSLGYLVPAVLSGKRVVVVTATKALQDQLSTKDLPFLAEHLDHDFTYAVLKGRSNYLCLQRAKEAISSDEQLGLEGMADRTVQREVERLVRWGTETATGDRAELLFEPTDKGWATVSVVARECPGALRCPMGEVCFCERAREAAVEADIVVVNAHLYGLHVASDGAVLPEHDVVVFDEAHQLEDVVAATAGLELGPSRFTGLAKAVRALIADDALIAEIDAAGEVLASALVEHLGRRLRGQPTSDLARALDVGRSRVERAMKAVRNAPDPGNADVDARKQRATKLGTALLEELAAVTEIADTDVAWVEGPAHNPVLKVAPVDVSRTLAARLWPSVTAILTSATIPPALAARLGIESEHDELDVGSPFDFEANAVLYCAAHLPDPRNDAYTAAVHDELTALIRAAGGRTLALFTSWRAMTAAADALTPVLKAEGIPVLTQSQLPKAALLNAFSADEATCLFATMSFWQGVDIAGRSLSLVVVDRLPFPRPDEPLMQARRELARGSAFAAVDLPRASTLLAQGAGRLIRTATDRGVVAVLDPRLASASYRWAVINALPPMRRTRDRAVVESFLREITAAS
jgi:ATP-dependent DNA helicase DinG